MKILEKQTKILYRFRCRRCRSKFEMTKDEKEQNDWKYGDNKGRSKSLFPHNPLDKFYCPVCKKVEYVRKEDMHKVIVMNNGNEIEY